MYITIFNLHVYFILNHCDILCVLLDRGNIFIVIIMITIIVVIVVVILTATATATRTFDNLIKYEKNDMIY